MWPTTCRRIADSTAFQVFIVGVIVANAIVLGLDTYESIDRDIGDELSLLNDIFLAIFVVEIAIRIAAFGSRPQDYFRDGWNVFDFVVIAASFLPGVRENATLLRVIRLLRVVRIVTVFPDLRFLLRGMVRSLPPIGSMAMLTVLLIYMYGMVGWLLFDETDPADWGNIGQAMLSLFVVLTLESWPDIMESGHRRPPRGLDLLRLLRPDRLVPADQHGDRDPHQQPRGAARPGRSSTSASTASAGPGRREPGGSADASERIALIREALDELEEDLHIEGRAEAPGAKGSAPKVMRRFRG